MSLKKKLILLLLISGITLAIAFYISFNVFMLPTLKENKSNYIENLEKKFKTAMGIEAQNISLLCDAWSVRQNIRRFVESGIKGMDCEIFPDKLFWADLMDLALVVDLSGNILYFKGYQDGRKLSDPVGLEIEPVLKKITRLITRMHQKVKSTANTAYGPLLFAANPIWNIGKEKRVIGILINGQFIDPNMVERLSQFTLESLEIFTGEPGEIAAFLTEHPGGRDFFFVDHPGELSTFHVNRDIFAKPIQVVRGRSDNNLYRVLNRHTVSFMIITLVVILILGFLLYCNLERSMIRRTRDIADTMRKIGSFDDLSVRIREEKAQDEISALVRGINLALDKLETEKINRENAERAMMTHSKLVSIGRLSSHIAHEINNPILAISNSLQVIKKKTRGESKILDEAFEISESEIDRIRKITSDLLDFHHSDQEEFCLLDVKEVVEQSLDLLKWSGKLGVVKISLEMEGDCPVFGSPSKLKQVFINFILNAVEAVGDKMGELTVEVRNAPGGFVEIHFIDNGPGVAPELREYLFEPFSSTKGDKGVGLGLYISYEIINNHQGDISYFGNDKGAHFIIKLPAKTRCSDGQKN